jgi:hypothetical protein
MECWVHHDAILDDDQANQLIKEAWEHDDSKDELKIDLQGLERHFWLGTEAGRLGCYNFPGETWAGDGSAHKGVMGAGSVCLQQQSKYLEVRVGRKEEGDNSLRPELAAWPVHYKPHRQGLTCSTCATVMMMMMSFICSCRNKK